MIHNGITSQSHHIGIEMAQVEDINVNAVALNRTILELKYGSDYFRKCCRLLSIAPYWN